MNKRIKNIVFYKFWDPTREEPMQQACIFYEDGTVKNTTYEEGQELANVIVAEEKVATKAEFVKLINTKRIYALTGKEFENRFKEFLGTGAKTVPTAQTTALTVVPENKPMVIPQPASTPGKATKPVTSTKPTDKKPVVVPPVSLVEPINDFALSMFSFNSSKILFISSCLVSESVDILPSMSVSSPSKIASS